MTHSDDKPVREKLVARGAESLTDEELLSILLGEGVHGMSALETARKALSENAGGFAGFSGMELQRLRKIAGMGIGRAAVLAAALEAGRRAVCVRQAQQDTVVSDRDVVEMFRPMLAQLPHEEFWALYLSSSNKIVDRVRISQGGVQGTVVDHKLIVKRAVELLAPGIIVVHNHPSGSARPSGQDAELTRRLETAASLFEITLLDHIIIASGDDFSFRREGLVGAAEE